MQNYSHKLEQIREASKANETKRALAKNWKKFENWCLEKNISALPCSPDTLEAFLIHLMESKYKVATIEQAKWAIVSMHKLQNFSDLSTTKNVQNTLQGIRRILGVSKKKRMPLRLNTFGK